jgi:hypothetical protein
MFEVADSEVELAASEAPEPANSADPGEESRPQPSLRSSHALRTATSVSPKAVPPPQSVSLSPVRELTARPSAW